MHTTYISDISWYKINILYHTWTQIDLMQLPTTCIGHEQKYIYIFLFVNAFYFVNSAVNLILMSFFKI